MAFEELSPELSQDLMLECVRALPFGEDTALLAFKAWDEEKADSEQSFLFRVDGFEPSERVWAAEADVRDVWAHGDTVVLLTATEVLRFEGGRFDAPVAQAHGVEGAKAIAGRSPQDLFVVGQEVAHFDGARWSKLAYRTGDESSLVDVAVVGNKAFAVGEEGEFVVVEGEQVREVQVPRADEAQFTALAVDADETVYLAGTICLQGKLDALREAPMPDDAELALGVGRFDGVTFWGFVGDEDGLGLFAQEGDELVPLAGEVAARMAGDPRFLYVAGESLAFRVDGEDLQALALDYDDESARWVLSVAEAEEEEEG